MLIELKMFELKPYKCVNCGEPAAALFKSYGPSVLKLTNCENCNGIVDKYVEYDPVIVMIDLVLMSREAQRHLLYNTEFKVYWKLFIILMMLETYGVWRNDSLMTFGIEVICNKTDNVLHETYPNILELNLPESLKSNCGAWTTASRDDGDLFIWEKDFYIQFISTFSGTAAFIATTYCLMRILLFFSKRSQVPLGLLVKGFSLASAHRTLALPALVWGAAAARATRALHHALVAAYGAVLMYNVFTVIYRRRAVPTTLALVASYSAQLLIGYHALPIARDLVK